MKIVLIGAYGYTASIICQLLNEQNIPFIAAGKKEASLKNLSNTYSSITGTKKIDLSLETDITTLINEFDVIINTAGPFTEESSAFVQEVARAKDKVYLDITGEISFVKESHESNHENAIRNNTLIIHGCAFESLIVDLSLRHIERDVGSIDDLYTFYRFSKSKPSPGTKITMKLSKYRNLFQLSDKKWIPVKKQENIQLHLVSNNHFVGVPYPLPEIAYAKWHGYRNAMSYLVLPEQEAAFMGLRPSSEGNIQEELANLKQRKKTGPTNQQREDQACQIYLHCGQKNNAYTFSVEGTDMYLATAKCIVEGVKRVLSGDAKPKGVCPPSALFKGIEKETLELLGFELQKENNSILSEPIQ